jgi:phosphoribosylformylglycinamidine synthase subunit PurS
MKATVYVRLKQEVLDPQGDAIRRSLAKLGFADVHDVRVGKLIEIDLGPALPGPDLEAKLKKMADEMLANAVIEDYEIQLETTSKLSLPPRVVWFRLTSILRARDHCCQTQKIAVVNFDSGPSRGPFNKTHSFDFRRRPSGAHNPARRR